MALRITTIKTKRMQSVVRSDCWDELKGLQSNYHYYDFEGDMAKDMIYDIIS